MKTKLLIWVNNIWTKGKKTILYICLFTGLLLIAFFVGKCSTSKERKLSTSNLIAARDSVHQSYVTIDGLKNSVFEKDAIILNQDQAIKAGIAERDLLKALHLKDLVTNTELTGVVKILRDSLKLPPQTVFITVKDTSGITHDYVRIPFTLLSVKEKYVTLSAGMNPNKTAWYDLSVPFSGTMSIGYVGTGFLKLKLVPKGIFTTENPYIKISDMNVLIVQDQKKWYQKFWFHALVGGTIVESVNIFLKK